MRYVDDRLKNNIANATHVKFIKICILRQIKSHMYEQLSDVLPRALPSETS